MNVNRESLEHALTIINTFNKGTSIDIIYLINKNKILTLQVTSQSNSACIPLSSSEINSEDSIISLSLEDLQTALSVLNKDEELNLELDSDEEKIKITDKSGGTFNVIALNGIPFTEKSVHETVVIVQNNSCYLELLNKALIFLPTDSGSNDFIFFRPDSSVIVFDTNKVLQLQAQKIGVKTKEIIALPYRLALSSFRNYVGPSINVSIVRQIDEDGNKHIAIKFSENYWMRVGDYFKYYEGVDEVLKGLETFSLRYKVNLPNVSNAQRSFAQLNKFLQKEENPYVVIMIDNFVMDIAAIGIKTDGILSKQLEVVSNIDGTIQFMVNPKFIMGALSVIKDVGEATILLSDNPNDPIGIIPHDMEDNICSVFIKKVKLV